MTYNSLRFVVLLVIICVLGILVLSVKTHAWEIGNKESLRDYAIYVASKEGLNVGVFLATLKCEGDFYNGQSYVLKEGGPNGREDSWGVAQINLPYHPEITKAQALNPFWSINWMADQWLKGNEWKWSCWHTKGLGYLKFYNRST